MVPLFVSVLALFAPVPGPKTPLGDWLGQLPELERHLIKDLQGKAIWESNDKMPVVRYLRLARMTKPKGLLPILIKRITFCPKHPDAEYSAFPSFEDQYPVAYTVCAYGMTVVSPLLKELSQIPHDTSSNGLVMRRSVIIACLREIFSTNDEGTELLQFRIKLELKRLYGDEKANLEYVLKFFR